MILYYPYAEPLYDHPRLADSRKFLDTLRAAHPDWTIIEQACGKDTRYEDGFKALWGQDDLIVLEQDLVPTLAVVEALVPAHHGLCAQAYPLHHDTANGPAIDAAYARMQLSAAMQPENPTAQAMYGLCAQAYHLWHQAYRPNPRDPRQYFSTIAHRHKAPIGTHKQRWIDEGEPWADLAGLGLLRITQNFARVHAPDWRVGPWDNLDTRFSEWAMALNIPFHIHWPPIPHHHHCPCHREEEGGL